MGLQFFDQYMYLHFASGIVAYYWSVSLKNWIILHTIFEIVENTHFGVHFIKNNKNFNTLSRWPGGKPHADSIINRVGDTFGALLGWLSAYYLDKLGKKYGWYQVHLKN